MVTVEGGHMGHILTYQNGEFYYLDDMSRFDVNDRATWRTCIRCGREATPEGYDPCVGHVPGATSVCCGHGGKRLSIIRLLGEDEGKLYSEKEFREKISQLKKESGNG